MDNDSVLTSAEVENYSSALSNRDKVETKIIEEIAEGRYVVTQEKPTVISALGAVPKPNGDIRLIHDCSQPTGKALNDYATLSGKLSYQSVQDATALLKPGSFMAKVDLKSAYRSVKLHTSQYPITGIKWTFSGSKSPTHMYDIRLPFGARFSPGHFHRLTQAVRRFMAKRGYQVVVFLDDFLVISDTEAGCLDGLNMLVKLLCKLGFSIALDKTVGPTQCLTFLGLQLDSVSFSLQLPLEKVSSLYDLLQQFQTRS